MAAEHPPFFPEYQRLSQVALGVEALATTTGTDISGAFSLAGFQATLGAPIEVLVLGGVNSGKSTLVNALFRAPLAPTGKLPTTSEICFHTTEKHAGTMDVVPGSRVVAHRNPPYLDEFVVIDTPGAGRLTTEQAACLVSLLQKVDIVLAVLPTADPWSPLVWDLIEKIPTAHLPNLTLVLQHADLRSPDDIKVMKGHLATLAQKRCGMVPPVFPVALPGPPADDSGHLELWRHIIDSLDNRSTRGNELSLWKTRVTDALHLIDKQIDSFDSILSKQNRFLIQTQSHIDEIRAHFTGQLEPAMEELAKTLTAEGRRVARSLAKRLAVVPSMIRIFGRDRTAEVIGREFTERLGSVIRTNGTEDAAEIVYACMEHWEETDRTASREGISLGVEKESIARLLQQASDKFVQNLEKTIAERIEALDLRNQMVKLLRSRNRALGAFAGSSLTCFMLGGITGSMMMPWIPYLFCALGILFTTGGARTAWKSRPQIVNAFLSYQAAACSKFTNLLQEGYESAVHGMFREYATALAPIHDDMKLREAEVKPLQQQWQELYLLVKSIETPHG